MRIIRTIQIVVEGQTIEVDQLEDGKFRKPEWLLAAARGSKRIEFTGNALMRHGGDNTRPWMEEALKNGFHEMPDDEAVSEEARKWKGWGTALKPAWEPILIARKIG